MKNISIGMMIGIVVVVAVVTSIATTSFTGKAILSNTADSVNPMTVKSSNWLQAIFQGTGNAGGIGIKSYDGKQFEIQSVQAGGIPGTSKNGLIIYDRNANQYRQVITSDGNIGIGTTNPTAKLDVNGDIKANNIYTKTEIDSKFSGGRDEIYTLRATSFQLDGVYPEASIEEKRDGLWYTMVSEVREGNTISVGDAQIRIDKIDYRGKNVTMSGLANTVIEVVSDINVIFDKDVDTEFVVKK